MNDFIKVVKTRRSIYNLGNIIPVSDEQIIEIVTAMVKDVPTPYNCQANRAVVLLKDEHKKLWNLIAEIFEERLKEKFPKTKEKLDTFKAGYGTVLFFEDTTKTEELKKQFPTYKDTFDIWASHSIAMLQFAVWTALSSIGVGASLQHYNPIIDDRVKENWNLPKEWKLTAQMPFGAIMKIPQEKEYLPIEDKIKVFK